MSAVIDTNCLLASISPNSPYFWLYRAFEQEQFVWAVSTEVLLEYEEVITRFYSKRTADLVLNLLMVAPNTIITEPFYRWNLLEDADDNKFFDLAIVANAAYLVTNDKGFNKVKNNDFPRVEICSLQVFKDMIVTG